MPLASTAYDRPINLRLAPLSTLDTLSLLATPGRLALAVEIAAELGSGFVAGGSLIGSAGLPTLVHRATGLVFAAIPGGEFIMGMTREEIAEIVMLYAALGRAEEAREAVSWATQPPRRVGVLPFLCAVSPVTDRIAYTLLADIHHGDDETYVPRDAPIPFAPRVAAELRGALGFRFLAEAEWEWIAREGGVRTTLAEKPKAISLDLDPARSPEPRPNAYGIDLYHAGLEFVADRWHKGYDGAPGYALAWAPRVIPEHTRGCPSDFRDDIEAIRLWAGVREGKSGEDSAMARFALDLPFR